MKANWFELTHIGKLFSVYTRRLPAFLLMAAIFFLFNTLPADTVKAELDCTPGPHSGAISSDQLWCAADNPHTITGTFTVNAPATLTIQPGVNIMFSTGTYLSIYGNLSAVGNSSMPITFTSSSTFSSILLQSNSVASLDYCDISHAVGAQGAVGMSSSSVTINHCNIHDNTPGLGAIWLAATGITPTIQNTTIQNNSNYAIYQNTADMAPIYQDLTFAGNGSDAVFLGGGGINLVVTLDSRELGGKPYIASYSVVVNTGATLRLNPGTILRFPQAGGTGAGLTISSGAFFIAEGSPTEPIVITSTAADTWYSTHTFQAGSTVSLAYCDISHASLVQGALSISSSSVSIDHCIIHDNTPGLGAIWLAAAGISPTIQNTIIQNNSNYAIYQNTVDMAPIYQDLTFTGNGSDAVFLGGGGINLVATLDSRELGGKPYIASHSVVVNTGATLRLNPGTILRFPQAGGTGAGLTINSGASFIAEGSPTEPIVITSTAADTWYSTHTFQAGSIVSLAYCDISHASLVQGALSISSSSVSIDHCIIHDNTPGLGAIWLAAAGITPTIQNTTIQNNTNYAIYQNTADMAPVYRAIIASGNGTNAIAIYGGNLTTGRNWSIGQSGLEAHVLTGLAVSNAGFLALDPGTILKFHSSASVNVNGGFYALGTTNLPITLTDSTGLPGTWKGITFQSTSTAILDNCNISYSDPYQPMVRIYSSRVSIQNSKIFGSLHDGIFIIGAQPMLNYNQIYGNAFGLRNNTPTTVVNAINNWWGDPSGPYHATSNPTGIGNAVSNGVIFSPWLSAPDQIGELPVGSIYLDLVSQTRASPGQPVAYAIWYDNLSVNTVENAVLVLSLPNTAQYKSSSAGGIFWPARNQVFWKLGALNPEEAGAVAVQATYEWGIPDLTLEASMAVMLGSDLESGQLVLSDYLNYQVYTVVSQTSITETQFNVVRSQQPDLNTLFNQALGAGFVQGVYNQQLMSNSDLFTQAVLLREDLSEIALVSGKTDGAMSYIIGRYYIVVASPSGEIVRYDLQNHTLSYPTSLSSTTSPVAMADVKKVNCLTNCLILETGTSLLTEFAPILGKIGTISDCVSFLAQPSDKEAAASCAASVQEFSALRGDGGFRGQLLQPKRG